VRAEDPKYSLHLELKAGDCPFFRVEITNGFAKAHGRLVGVTSEQGASDLKVLTPIDPSHLRSNPLIVSFGPCSDTYYRWRLCHCGAS
jgi:hypothetical protein